MTICRRFRIGALMEGERWTAPNSLTLIVITAAFVMAPWNSIRIHPNIAYSDILFVVAAATAFFALQQQRSRARIPVALLIVACLFSIPALADAARFGPTDVISDLVKLLIASIVFPIVVAWSLSFSSRAPRIATYGWIAGSTASAVIAALNKFGYFPFGIYDSRIYVTGRYAGLTQYPNMIGLFSGFAVILLFALILGRHRSQMWRAALILGLLPNLYAIQLSGSRAAFIGLVAGLLTTVVVWPGGRQKRRLLLRLVVLAPIAAAVWFGLECVSSEAGACSSPIISRLFGSSNTSASDSERLQLLKAAWVLFLEHPFLGSGSERSQHAHNIFLQLLVAGGLVAFSGLLVYFAYFAWLLAKLRSGASEGGEDIINIIGAYACTVSWLVNGLFQPFLTERTCYLGLGLILSHHLYMHAARRRTTRKNESVAMKSPRSNRPARSTDDTAM